MNLLKQPLAFLLVLLALPAFGQNQDSSRLPNRPLDLGLVYPLSTSGRKAARYRHEVSFSALAGVSGAVSQAAVAGIANVVGNEGDGGLVAGIANVAGGGATGAQIAGIANCIGATVRGAEIAGLVNTAGDVTGTQVAGITNVSGGDVRGLQIAGILNRAGKVHSQVAGIVNRATRVKGVQISGLVNIAGHSDYPIGLINLIADGQQQIGIQSDAGLNTLAFFRSGGRVLYGIVALGYNLQQHRGDYYILEGGIGAHLLRGGSRFGLNSEATMLTLTDFTHGHAYIYSLALLPEVRLSQRISVFAGPSVNLMLDYAHGRIAAIVHHYPWTTRGPSGHFIGGYAGLRGGIALAL